MKTNKIKIDPFPQGKSVLERIVDEAEDKHERQKENQQETPIKKEKDKWDPLYTEAIII